MARRKYAIFIILILGVAVLFFFSERGPLHRYKNSTMKASESSESENFQENEIGGKVSQDQSQVTEISSHGEERGTISRAANEVPRKPSRALTKPDARSLEASLLLENTRWKIWSGVSAIAKTEGARSDSLGEMGGFYLVEDERFRSDERNFSGGSPLVLFDQRRDVVGILTGTFELVLNDGVDIQALASNHDLKVINAFPESKMYFVTSEVQPFNLQALYQSLKNDSGIRQIEPEILSRQYEKH